MAMYVRDIFAPMKAYLGLSTLLSAADDNRIVTSENMAVGALTIAAQPSVPSLLGLKVTASGTADTPGIATIVATDFYDRTFTEVVTLVVGSTVYNTRYCKTVTSITLSGWVIDAGSGNDTIIVGVLSSGAIEAIGCPVTFEVVSGNVWINDKTVAVADATAFKLLAGQVFNLVPRTNALSFISDTAATIQVVIWDN